MRRPLIVMFDVSSDGRRNQVRDALRPLGSWYQRSVWVLAPTSTITVGYLAQGLDSLLKPADRLIVLEPCPACLRGALWVPAVDPPWRHDAAVV